MYEDWFEVDDGEADDVQGAFVDVVRSYARNWPECPPNHAIVLVFNEEEDMEECDEDVELRRIVDVSDLPGKQILLSLGASLIGNTLLCSEVHNQTYLPQDSTLVMRPPGDLRSSSQTTMISGGRLPQGCGHAE